MTKYKCKSHIFSIILLQKPVSALEEKNLSNCDFLSHNSDFVFTFRIAKKDIKGIVHFEIKMWYLSAYPKGIQDVGVFFLQ